MWFSDIDVTAFRRCKTAKVSHPKRKIMNKFSVNIDTLLKNQEAKKILTENPRAFRYVNAAIAMIIEAAITGREPESIVPIVGPSDLIDIRPDRIFLVAQRSNRVRCNLFTGNLGPIIVGAYIYFLDKGGRAIFGLSVGADSDGIRYIRHSFRNTLLCI